jgi:hypothetical protein
MPKRPRTDPRLAQPIDNVPCAEDALMDNAEPFGEPLPLTTKEAVAELIKNEKPDMVNRPSHYAAACRIPEGNYDPETKIAFIECLDVIEALNLDMTGHLQNVFKYIWRAGKKQNTDTLEDLKKAQVYLDRHIVRTERTKESKNG